MKEAQYRGWIQMPSSSHALQTYWCRIVDKSSLLILADIKTGRNKQEHEKQKKMGGKDFIYL